MSTKEIKNWKNKKKQTPSGEYFILLQVPSWCGRFDTPCIIKMSFRETIHLSKICRSRWIMAVTVVVPFYFQPKPH
jgi:hypothetical protein